MPGHRFYLLARLVAKAATFVLTATQNVANQSLPAIETSSHERLVLESHLDQRPTSAYPMAVAAIDELVGSTGKTPLRGMLLGRKP
jgi:hypothetical protein